MQNIRGKLFIGGLLGLAVIAGLLLYADIRDVSRHLLSFPVPLLLPISLLMAANYAVRWRRWHYYLSVIGVENISRRDSAALWVAAFPLVLSPGKVGEFLKAAGLNAIAGTPVARGAPVVLSERITDGLALLTLAAIGFSGILIGRDDVAENLTVYLPLYVAVLGVLVGGVALIQFKTLALGVLDRIERLLPVSRLARSLRTLYDSSYDLLRPRLVLLATGLGILGWSGECMLFFVILTGLGIAPSWLLLMEATFIVAAGRTIGAVSGLPAGLGAVEFTVAGILQLLVLGRADPGLAGTATLLLRLFNLWIPVAAGFVTAFVFRRRLFAGQILDQEQDKLPSETTSS